MAVAVELIGKRPGEVPRITVPFLSVRDEPMQRLYSEDSLDFANMQAKIAPNGLFLVEVLGSDWMFFAPVGGYTPRGLHIMAMRWDRDYVAGPEDLSPAEGEALMTVKGNIISALMEDPENVIIDVGWNWSRRSFGQAGYQSIPTKLHFSLFSMPDFSDPLKRDQNIEFVSKKELKPADRLALIGSSHNMQLGRLLLHILRNGEIEGNQTVLQALLDVDSATVSRRGIRIPTRKPLDDLLRSKGIFKDVTYPIAVFLDRLAQDMSIVFTDLKPADIDRRVEETATDPDMSLEQRRTILDDLARPPLLLPTQERLGNIEGLEGRYTPDFLRYLREVNAGLPDTGPVENWKIGFGYMAAMHYDRLTDEGFFAVSAAVANGPGGILEGTEGVLLRRPSDSFTREEVALRIESIRRCIERAFDERNGYHEVAKLKAVFVN